MKIKLLLFLLFINSFVILCAQQRSMFTSVDKSIANIPDSLTGSCHDIANFINSKFELEEDKIRAVYIWIAKNIEYDIQNMYEFNTVSDDIIEKTLITRKGICQNYTELFYDITNKLGIKSFIVLGYTKDGGKINSNPHSWCVAQINSDWYMFDPTWGGGSIKNSKYIKQINDEYFKMPPKRAIRSHMPFDPLWQLLDYPITYPEFSQGRGKANSKRTNFNYRDTLKAYEKQSDIERTISIKNRVEKNIINSYLIYSFKRNLENKIATYYNNIILDKYNSAKNLFNKGMYLLNRFIDYRNDHFIPDKGDEYLIEKIEEIEEAFRKTKIILDSIEKPDANTITLMIQLRQAVDATMVEVNEQKSFVAKVLDTPKNYRKSLFYTKM